MKNKKHILITVKGKVQNVGFRYFTNKRAHETGIYGYVKNLPNGDVYAEAEGSETDLDTFLDHLRQGPQWARVDGIDIQEAPLDGFEDFTIR
jgi:acylphosphatase